MSDGSGRLAAPGAPPSLLAEMERLAGADGGRPVALAEAALRGLSEVLDGPGGRESARTLLAADALLTRACEEAARRGGGSLDALVRDFGPARFEALLAVGPA